MSAITLNGGPVDGKTIKAPSCLFVLVPEYVPPKKWADENSGMVFDKWGFVRWANPDENCTFRQHRYDARTGEYVGVDT